MYGSWLIGNDRREAIEMAEGGVGFRMREMNRKDFEENK